MAFEESVLHLGDITDSDPHQLKAVMREALARQGIKPMKLKPLPPSPIRVCSCSGIKHYHSTKW